MRRSTRGAFSPDAKLRGISDEQLADLLDAARRRLARGDALRDATAEAAAYASAVAALELEATRRGLERASPHERPLLVQVLRRLSQVPPTLEGGEWPRLLGELDVRGLLAVYRYALDGLRLEEREAAFVHLCFALDRLAYGERNAELRQAKHVELPSRMWMRLGKLNLEMERTFGLLIERLTEEGTEG